MCGLAGVASTMRMKDYQKRNEAMFDAMWMNTLRGDHSTGIAAITDGRETSSPAIWKRALAAPDFLALPTTQAILRDIDKFSMVLTHNRAATTDKVNNENAHPFQFGHITLTHNGHINNAASLVEYNTRTNIGVDSAQVAQAMQVLGEKETLERVTGNYAFVWHNAKDGTLNFARNSGRPLKFCYIRGENTMFWMSEREMLVSILRRNGLDIEPPFFSVPEKLWFKFKADDFRKYTTIPFAPRPAGTPRTPAASGMGAPSTTGTGSGNNNGTTPSTSPNTTRESFQIGARRAEIQLKLIAELLNICKKPSPDEIARREKELAKQSGRPLSGRKENTAGARLGTTGFGYDQLVCVVPSQYESYKNQQGRMGQIFGTIFNTEIQCHLSNMTMKDFTNFKDYGIILGKVVNIKPHPTSDKQCLVIEPHPLAEEFSAEWKKRWARVAAQVTAAAAVRGAVQQTPPAHVSRLGEPADDSIGRVGSGGFTHLGPHNTCISLARYKELTKHGCAECSGDLGESVEESKKIFWIDNSPFCFTCSNDPKTQDAHNIPTKRGVTH